MFVRSIAVFFGLWLTLAPWAQATPSVRCDSVFSRTRVFDANLVLSHYQEKDYDDAIRFIRALRAHEGVNPDATADGYPMFHDLAPPSKRYSTPDGEFLILRDQRGRLVGTAGFTRVSEHTCELKKFYLDTVLRGHGLGHKLLDLIFDHARALGYREIVLQTDVRLQEATKLYAHMGFMPMTEKGHESTPHALYYFRPLGD